MCSAEAQATTVSPAAAAPMYSMLKRAMTISSATRGLIFCGAAEGSDDLTGGGGADTFFFLDLTELGDTIEDFGTGNDVLQFDGDAFGGLADGPLDPSLFLANQSGNANNASQRFIYETDTGILRYDANGSQGGGVSIVATLTGAPVIITAADIVIGELPLFA